MTSWDENRLKQRTINKNIMKHNITLTLNWITVLINQLQGLELSVFKATFKLKYTKETDMMWMSRPIKIINPLKLLNSK